MLSIDVRSFVADQAPRCRCDFSWHILKIAGTCELCGGIWTAIAPFRPSQCHEMQQALRFVALNGQIYSVNNSSTPTAAVPSSPTDAALPHPGGDRGTSTGVRADLPKEQTK